MGTLRVWGSGPLLSANFTECRIAWSIAPGLGPGEKLSHGGSNPSTQTNIIDVDPMGVRLNRSLVIQPWGETPLFNLERVYERLSRKRPPAR